MNRGDRMTVRQPMPPGPGPLPVGLAAVERDDMPSLPPGEREDFLRVSRWARTYLVEPHADLGRSGAVCPYVQKSLDRDLFFVATFAWQGVPEEVQRRNLLAWRDRFRDLEPRSGPNALLKSLALIFPAAGPGEAERRLESLQRSLKDEFVGQGLMLGEFHSGPPAKPGLWNPDFQPLRSPVPLLAIRFMVPSDLPFLVEDPEWVRAYLRRFADDVPQHLVESVRAVTSKWHIPWTAPAAPAAHQRGGRR